MNENKQGLDNNDIIGTAIQSERLARDSSSLIGLANPGNVAKDYHNIAKNTENKLNQKVRHIQNKYKRVTRSDYSSLKKNEIIAKTKKKLDKAVEKRDTYVNKNYRKESIKKSLILKYPRKAKDRIVTSVKTKIISSDTGSNIIKAGNKVVKAGTPLVKSAKISKNIASKGLKFTTEGRKMIKNFQIQAVLEDDPYKMAFNVGKNALVGTVNVALELMKKIMQLIGRGIIKLLMPVVPYILLIFVPFIAILLIAGAGDSEESERETMLLATMMQQESSQSANYFGTTDFTSGDWVYNQMVLNVKAYDYCSWGCGLTSLADCLAYFGVTVNGNLVNPQYIYTWAKDRDIEGIAQVVFEDFCAQTEVKNTGLKMERLSNVKDDFDNTIGKALDEGKLVIINAKYGSSNAVFLADENGVVKQFAYIDKTTGYNSHFFVLCGWGDNKEAIRCADPNGGKIRYAKTELLKENLRGRGGGNSPSSMQAWAFSKEN